MKTENKKGKKNQLYKELLSELSKMTKDSNPFIFERNMARAIFYNKIEEFHYLDLSKEFEKVCKKLRINMERLSDGHLYGELLLELAKADKNFNPFDFSKRMKKGLSDGDLKNEQYRILEVMAKDTCAKLDISIKNKMKSTKKLVLKDVTKITHKQFYRKGIKELILPIELETMGDGAFADNHIESIMLPRGLSYIPSVAFADNLLKQVVIPKGVKEIGYCAFAQNQIKTVIFQGDVTKIHIHETAFDLNPVMTCTHFVDVINKKVAPNYKGLPLVFYQLFS